MATYQEILSQAQAVAAACDVVATKVQGGLQDANNLVASLEEEEQVIPDHKDSAEAVSATFNDVKEDAGQLEALATALCEAINRNLNN